MHPNYLPYEERKPDPQYLKALATTLPENDGEYIRNQFQDKGRYSNFALAPLDFKLKNGFPLITERKVGFWRKFINEMAAFNNGARTLAEMRKYGTDKTWPDFWEKWLTPEKCADFDLAPGDMGLGYSVLGACPRADGPPFNQFLAMIDQMRDFPGVTTHMVTSWMPAYTLGNKRRRRKVVVAPCHGTLVRIIINNGRLTMQHVQRSADMPVGAIGNMIAYPGILLELARVLDLEPYRYVHYFLDPHTYEDQIPWVYKLLERDPRPFPTVRIKDDAPRDFLDFRAEHFELTDYNPHPAMNDIPVTE